MARPRARKPEPGVASKLITIWRQAEPATRRNSVVGGLVVVWAFYLMYDMRSLQKDPRLREKLKLDDPDSPTLASAWKERFNKLVRGKDADDY